MEANATTSQCTDPFLVALTAPVGPRRRPELGEARAGHLVGRRVLLVRTECRDRERRARRRTGRHRYPEKPVEDALRRHDAPRHVGGPDLHAAARSATRGQRVAEVDVAAIGSAQVSPQGLSLCDAEVRQLPRVARPRRQQKLHLPRHALGERRPRARGVQLMHGHGWKRGGHRRGAHVPTHRLEPRDAKKHGRPGPVPKHDSRRHQPPRRVARAGG